MYKVKLLKLQIILSIIPYLNFGSIVIFAINMSFYKSLMGLNKFLIIGLGAMGGSLIISELLTRVREFIISEFPQIQSQFFDFFSLYFWGVCFSAILIIAEKIMISFLNSKND